MNRKTRFWVPWLVGMSILVSGIFLLLSLGLEGGTHRGYYDVKGGATLELPWNLEKGDRTEGGFTVSGGNEEVRFYIKNPYQVVIYDAGIVKSHYSTGFTAGHPGVYSFYFENLESFSDKRIHVTFRSPYEPRFTVFGKPSLLMIVFGGLILVCLLIWSRAKALFFKNSPPRSGNTAALPPHDHTLRAPITLL